MKSLGRIDILINMASIYLKTPNPKGRSGRTHGHKRRSVIPFLDRCGADHETRRRSANNKLRGLAAASGRPHYRGYMPYYYRKPQLSALTRLSRWNSRPKFWSMRSRPGRFLSLRV